MITTAGFFGTGVRGDCLVSISDHPNFEVEVRSLVQVMYGRAIEAQIRTLAEKLGNPRLRVLIEDSGALPFTITARFEAAVSAHNGLNLPQDTARSRTPTRDRSRRTRLYLPGNTPKFFPHAGLFGADAIILDLEDSVPPNEKSAALSLVIRALREVDFGGSELTVRVNNPAEAQAVALAGAEAILIPKVESAAHIHSYEQALDAVKAPTLLIAILESAKGVMQAYEIATASPRMVAISLGIEDYTTDIGAQRTTSMDESAWAHGQVLNAARAAEISPLASVFARVDDESGMTEYAAWAKRMGFDGVGCIHPGQIAPAHRGFAPTETELEQAHEIVAEFEASLARGVGAVAVNGKMVDKPIYERAKRLVRFGQHSGEHA